MAEFALVQAAMRTTIGTQDFTVSGFGTPKGALFFASYGLVNGTVENHAMVAIGGTDGTRSRALAQASEDGQADSDTGGAGSTTAAVVTLLNTDQSMDGSADFDSWITDGVRINWTDAPPAAYLLNVILIGGTGVSSVYVDNASTPTVIDTATDVAAPGFEPDIVLCWSFDNTSVTSATSSRYAFGIAHNSGSNAQHGINMLDANAAANMQVAGRFSTDSVVHDLSVARNAQIQGYDASGFDLYLRGTTGTAIALDYMAIKLNGVSATLVQSASPTATGSHSITNAGFTPQFGLMLHGEFAAVDTDYAADDGEVWGLSAFTAANALTSSVYCEDSDGTSNTESMTDTKPVRLRKDNADFMTATFTTFTSNGVTFNYTATNGVARQRSVLFVEGVQDSTYAPALAMQRQGGVMIGRRYV